MRDTIRDELLKSFYGTLIEKHWKMMLIWNYYSTNYAYDPDMIVLYRRSGKANQKIVEYYRNKLLWKVN